MSHHIGKFKPFPDSIPNNLNQNLQLLIIQVWPPSQTAQCTSYYYFPDNKQLSIKLQLRLQIKLIINIPIQFNYQHFLQFSIVLPALYLIYNFMKSVIQLVKTAQGYSVVEEGHEVNKISNRNTKQKQYNSAPKKFTQQNFTIYPYVYCQQPEYSQKYIIIPAKSQWFNLNQIHQIEKKALPEWFKTKKVVFGAAKPDKFEKNQELYKKYRNYIIDLARNQYVSPTEARKGLAGDVCAIIRIHSFLERNGLINYVYPKKKEGVEQQPMRPQNTPNLSLIKRKDCVDKQKTIFEKHFDKDHLELLKKITKKYRPHCHLCEGICGVLWFEFQQQLVLKTFQKVSPNPEKSAVKVYEEQRKIEAGKHQQKMTITREDKPFTYLFRLCSSCFTTGTLPVVLSHEDFKKKSILDNLNYHYDEPKQKKKINEQNKLIEHLEKNKFNLRKTAESLRLSEQELLQLLMCLPVMKIQKLARIDAETQTEDNIVSNQSNKMKSRDDNLGVKMEESEQKLLEEFEKQLGSLQNEEAKLHEQLVQIWLLKISAKLLKLSEWQKSTTWFASRLINDQKNSLASALKQRQ